MRKVGSSGMATTPIHENIFRFMNKHLASTPRQILGVKIVQTAKTYYVFYIGPKEKKLKYCLTVHPVEAAAL